MQLLNFIEMFPGDTECTLYFKNIREHAGVECHNCGGKHHIWIDNRNQFRCVRCETMIHIKTGTIMEHSGLSIKYWFLAAYMLTSEEKSYTPDDILKKLDYLGHEDVKEMVTSLDVLMKSKMVTRNFNMLLYYCASYEQDHGIVKKKDLVK